MDRRNFLKTGGIALLGSLATGSAMALTTPGALGGEGCFGYESFRSKRGRLEEGACRGIGERRRLCRPFL